MVGGVPCESTQTIGLHADGLGSLTRHPTKHFSHTLHSSSLSLKRAAPSRHVWMSIQIDIVGLFMFLILNSKYESSGWWGVL